MAGKGDRQPRSSHRRQMAVISLRCTHAEKARHKRTALQMGFAGTSTWIKDLIQSHNTVSLRLRQTVSGRFGQIGGRITVILRQELPDEARAELAAIAAEVTQLQTDIIRGSFDDCESDS